MIIDKYDYHFDVDIEHTEMLYKNREKAKIDSNNQLPELVKFLKSLGIDIEKPDNFEMGIADVIYSYIGSAKSVDGYEIDIYGEEQYISIVVYSEDGKVTLEVFGMK